ncbi:hypothetical protein KP509_12G067400 [Ceratopteris richardii]|uniref:Rhodanese domain-containing protein n=1 Tax=Ceratopteris richardii TaxID=49495 RepID=A0A8T2TJZ8_CERRI|nr:hypothetical protein KP509_12G067400 [Ceratopteris richardii]
MRSSQSHFRPQCLPSIEPAVRSGRARPRLHSKYDNVRASIDSGLNMLKVNEKFPEFKVNARFKREEFFRRIKPATLVQLLHKAEVDCLILDVREHDAYLLCHIRNAISFPAAFLRRSVNIFSLEILKYVNKEPEKIIVFYDDNGNSASSTGNLFAEKGIDNIFMLNGGLREMVLQYPDMVEGQLEVHTSYFSGSSTPSVRSEPYTSISCSSNNRRRPPSSVSYHKT